MMNPPSFTQVNREGDERVAFKARTGPACRTARVQSASPRLTCPADHAGSAAQSACSDNSEQSPACDSPLRILSDAANPYTETPAEIRPSVPRGNPQFNPIL